MPRGISGSDGHGVDDDTDVVFLVFQCQEHHYVFVYHPGQEQEVKDRATSMVDNPELNLQAEDARRLFSVVDYMKD